MRGQRYEAGSAPFPKNLAGGTANGTWNLRVRDGASAEVGYVNGWSITL